MSTSYYLSFCDPERPAGSQFLGAAVVPGGSMIEAVRNAHMLGCNPGGEVLGQPVPEYLEPHIGTRWRVQLLTREECAAMDAELAPFVRPCAGCDGADDRGGVR